MSLRAFIRLSRLRFLAGGLAGGVLGAAVAARQTGHFAWKPYALAQATIVAFQLMTHYANDYFDRRSDVAGANTPYSGGSGVLAEGAISPWVAVLAASVCGLGGLTAAGALGPVSGRPTASLVAFGIGLGAWAYSAPPLRLVTHGLGEIDAALVVGLLVPLCTYAAAAPLPTPRHAAGLLPGFVAMFALMLAVECPDAATDRSGRKRTLIVRIGTSSAGRLGLASVVTTFASFGVALALGAPLTYGIAAALVAPVGVRLARTFAKWSAGEPSCAPRLAADGVHFFFLVTLTEVLAYAVATGMPASATSRLLQWFTRS